MKHKPKPSPPPQNLDSPPAGAGRGKGSARKSGHAVQEEGAFSPSPLAGEGWGEGAASETLVVSEGPITPYIAKSQQPRRSRESGNPEPLVPLTEVATMNPRGFDERPGDDDLMSFIPMKAVEEESGRLSAAETKRWGEVKKGYTPFQDGDVIFAKITPCMENGKYALATGLHGGRAAGSTEFHVFRPKLELDSKYLLHFLFTPELRSRARMNMKGAVGQLRVPAQFFNDVQIPLPPLAEQRRIVAELETQLTRLDASVTALKRVLANLKRYRASVLKAACEGRLVPTEAELARREGRSYESGAGLLACILEQHKKGDGKSKKWNQHEPPSTLGLAKLPDGWVWSSLGQCFTVGVGATPSRKESGYWNGDIPWVSSGEVQFGRITETHEHITRTGLENSSTKLNPRGSVLLAMIGQGRTRGQAALLEIEAANNQNCAAIWVGKTPIPPKYVYYWLMGRYEETRTRGSGNNQQALNKSLVEQIPLPLPPLGELKRIVAEVERRFSVIEELEATVAANLRRSERLRQVALHIAFTGQ